MTTMHDPSALLSFSLLSKMNHILPHSVFKKGGRCGVILKLPPRSFVVGGHSRHDRLRLDGEVAVHLVGGAPRADEEEAVTIEARTHDQHGAPRPRGYIPDRKLQEE